MIRLFFLLILLFFTSQGIALEFCPTDIESRKAVFMEELVKLKSEGKFVVFYSNDDFVQLAGMKEILLDIPPQMLTEKREEKLISLLGENAYKNTFQGGYSIQNKFDTSENAAGTIERIFREVYGFPEEFPVTSIETEESHRSFQCKKPAVQPAITTDTVPPGKMEVGTPDGKTVILYTDGTWKYKEAMTEETEKEIFTKIDEASKVIGSHNGFIELWYDPSQWSLEKSEESQGKFTFIHSSGEAMAIAIMERMSIPGETLKREGIETVKKEASDVKVISEVNRIVNKVPLLVMHLEATLDEISLSYLGYFWTGKEGTIQVIAYTTKDLFSEYEKEFTNFLDGIMIKKPE